MVANLITSEFRDRIFGADYNQELMRWITENYHLVARFESPHRQGANFGNEPFFILAYERNRWIGPGKGFLKLAEGMIDFAGKAVLSTTHVAH